MMYVGLSTSPMVEMDDEQKARVDRLVDYCKRSRKCLDDAGKVSAKKLAQLMEQADLKGSYAYWSGILLKKGRVFAAGKAREVEMALGMPHLYLDGGSEWPFDDIDLDKIRRLDAKKRAQLEGAILASAAALNIDIYLGEDDHGTHELDRVRNVG